MNTMKTYYVCFGIGLMIGSMLYVEEASAKKNNLQDKMIASSQTFINAHPDLLYRTSGLNAYKKQAYKDAFMHFKHAAKFADKPSQGMVAEMLWKGEGVEMNRPLAYAWMDLAAERQYITMLSHREKYWDSLNETERTQALALGAEVYVQYGDEVAKKRLANALRRGRNNITGSHTGFVSTLKITISTPLGPQTIDGSQYYQDKFWKPEEYAKWQDDAWKNPPTGRVEIGPLQSEPIKPKP
jgi:uncharacterized protein